MSAFKAEGGGGGGGISPEVLDTLVTDPELASTKAAILAAVATPASVQAVKDDTTALKADTAALKTSVGGKASQASVDAIKSDTDALKAAVATLPASGVITGDGDNTRTLLGTVKQNLLDGLAATQTALTNLLNSLTGKVDAVKADTANIVAGQGGLATLGNQAAAKAVIDAIKADTTNILAGQATAGAAKGEVRLLKTLANAVVAGWTRLTGLNAPGTLFSQGRVMLANFDYAAAGYDFSTAFANTAQVLGQDGLVYFIHSSGYLRAFNPNTEQWSIKANCAAGTTLSNFYNAAAVGRYIHYFCASTGYLSNWRYDTQTDSWVAKANLPALRFMPGCGYDATIDRVLLIGGHASATTNAANMNADIAVYDPTNNTWTTRPMPQRMARVRVVPLGAGKFFVLPGSLSDGTTVTGNTAGLCWVYDYVADTWTACDALDASIATGSYNQTTSGVHALVNGKVLLIPLNPPGSGGRGRIFDPTAAAGQQWSNFYLSATGGSGSGLWTQFETGQTNIHCTGTVLPNGLVLCDITPGAGNGNILVYVSTNMDGTTPQGDLGYWVKN
jgi:hypothetical protein